MATITRSIVIDAPIEKVFAFMDNPTNMLEIWPSMQDIRNVEDHGGGIKSYDWTYKMAGMKFEGSSKVVEYVPNQRLVAVTRGGIESTFTWTFTPLSGGTQVEEQIEYKVPMGALGRLAEGLILKQNERETDMLLANMKAHIEMTEPAQKV